MMQPEFNEKPQDKLAVFLFYLFRCPALLQNSANMINRTNFGLILLLTKRGNIKIFIYA